MRLNLQQAIHLLKSGDVVAVPTETVYGLAASLKFSEAIDQIFTLKKRPSDNPLIIHISNERQLKEFAAEYPPGFDKLSQAFWPGPLTFVLSVNPDTVPEAVRAGLHTVAFRMPSSKMALDLIDQVGPIVMPSANLSGKPSATMAEHVECDFGEDFPVLDGGFCKNGLESTIIIYRNGCWEIIRQGALSLDALKEIAPVRLAIQNTDKPICPGQKYRHYAPKTKLKPTKEFASDCHGVIVGFSDRMYPQNAKVYVLGNSHNAEEIAHQLYATFRQLDADAIQEAYIDVDLSNTSIFPTILERIFKACI